MTTPDPALAIRSPDWLAHRYDPEFDAVHFVRVERSLRRSAPFLTDENLTSASNPLILERRHALSTAPAPSPIHYIFHSAYCCSTLLANALDYRGIASSLKEPTILNDLVGWRHRGAPPARVAEVLDGSMALLARPFAAGEAVVVKPSNVVNGLAAAMLSMRPAAGCVLLYAPLDVYLGSIAAKGMWGRLWVRDLLAKQLKDGTVDLGFTPDEHFLQTDLQVAAVGWLAQHMMFAQLAARWPDRVRTLDSEVLVRRPEEALRAVAALFSLPIDDGAIGEITRTVFSRNAKDGAPFDRRDRDAGQATAASVHAAELEKVGVWARRVAETAGVDMTLPSPLLA